jgi:hypothetical protein
MIYFDMLTFGGLLSVVAVAIFLVHTCLTQGCSRCHCK